jgi:tetratricopeptide (TPR) repeat protein
MGLMAGRTILRMLCAGALLALAGGVAHADPVKGDVKVTTEGGYVRIAVRFTEEVPAKVSVAGAVLVIAFEKPIAVSVDTINASAPDYISAARQDPDGSAIRIALARKVKVNSIPAGERLFIDLLPDDWAGLAPGLPQLVIDELAMRAREAEAKLRKAQLIAPQRQPVDVRVKVGTQPTFVRYMFELPPQTNVTPKQTAEQLTLNFDAPIRFDLADAKVALPPTLSGIDSDLDYDFTSVNFVVKGQPKIRFFREDKTYMVDVATADETVSDDAPVPAKDAVEAKPAQGPQIARPETVPAAEPVKTAPLQQAEAPNNEPAQAAQNAPAQVVPPPATPTLVTAVEAAPVQAAPVEAKPEAQVEQAAAPTGPAKPASPPVMAQATGAPVAPAIAPHALERALPTPTARPDGKIEAKAKAAAPALPSGDPKAPVKVSLHRQGSNLRLDFPFSVPTPAAVFKRGTALWLVFDTAGKLNIGALKDEAAIRRAGLVTGPDDAAVLRIVLDKPQLASFFPEGSGWVLVVADSVVEPTGPVAVARSIVGKGRSSITIPFAQPAKQHRIADPDIGDTLLVVTALGPARGFLKSQDFVELRALPSTHGIAVQPLADDVTAELSADKIIISRPGGLSLSSASINRDNNTNAMFQPLMFDAQTWGFDRQAKFDQRHGELLVRAALASDNKKRVARLDLARFYLARDMAAEAKGVLDVVTADEREGEGTTGTVLKAVANVLLGRAEDALKDLNLPQIGNTSDAPIWRALAHAQQGRYAQAREEFRSVDAALGALPIELQRIAKREAMRASIEVRDYAGASMLLNDFESLGVPPELAPSLAVLTGRLEEGLGHNADALAAYQRAATYPDRKHSAQAQLRELVLRAKLGEIKRADLVAELERLTTVWRGDETEAEGLQILAHAYTEDRRYRDAFHVMRTALLVHPNSDLTRKIQDEAATTFDSLFLSTEADTMPAVEALGLFYDYRELTPIGRRGDEMIRRLADRLVSVDLLDQASELLQHQVDHRLMGAARAQVATRLAVIYLMNRKPDRALAAIQRSRSSDLGSELREQRLLLEARALTDIGRHDLAFEIISGVKSREALRLRADILWAAKKWRDAAENIERVVSERAGNPNPPTAVERKDLLRGAIAYALAEEPLGLARFRDKFAAKMADGPDRRAFEVVTAPIGSAASEFRAIAAAIATTGTLDAFLADMRARYPEKPEPAADDQAAAPQTTPASGPAGSALPQKPAASAPRNVDRNPTGSIGRPVQRSSR